MKARDAKKRKKEGGKENGRASKTAVRIAKKRAGR